MNEKLKKKYEVISVLSGLFPVTGGTNSFDMERAEKMVRRIRIDGGNFYVTGGGVKSQAQADEMEAEKARQQAEANAARRREVQAVVDRYTGIKLEEIRYAGRVFEVKDGVVTDCGLIEKEGRG